MFGVVVKCDVQGCMETLILSSTGLGVASGGELFEMGWVTHGQDTGAPKHTCRRCLVAPPPVRDLYSAAMRVKDVAVNLEDLGFVCRDCDDSSHDFEGCVYHVYYDGVPPVSRGGLHARVLNFMDEWSVVVVERRKVLLGPNNEPV